MENVDSENESLIEMNNFNFVDGPLTKNEFGCFDFCDSGPVFNESELSEDHELDETGTSTAVNEIQLRKRIESKSAKQLNDKNNSPPKFKFRRKRKGRPDKKSGDWTSTSTNSVISESESQFFMKKLHKPNNRKKVDVNSLSNYLNWRLINTCLSYKLSSEKDSELLELTLNRNFAKFKSTKLSVITELKRMLIFISIWGFLITCGTLKWGENFFSFESLFGSSFTQKDHRHIYNSLLPNADESSDQYSDTSDSTDTMMHFLFIVTFTAFSVGAMAYLLNIVFKLFIYIRLSYLIATLLSTLEQSKLCIKNTVQYLSDFSSVNTGFNFAHKGQSNQIKLSSIDANPALFRCLTELLVLDILSSQDACSQLPRDGVQFLDVHLCESVDVEKVIVALKDVDSRDEDSDDVSERLNSIMQLHYELVTEFFFNSVICLTRAFTTGNNSLVSEVISVFKLFIINYDGTVLNNLERELDLVHDLYLGLDINEEDLTVSSTRRTGDEYLQRQSEAFERSNLKSVITSFKIHLKEVANLSSQIKNEEVFSSRTLDVMKQRLQAAISCINNLELHAEMKNRQNEKAVLVEKKLDEEQLNRGDILSVVADTSLLQSCDNIYNPDNDDVFLGDTRLDPLSNEVLRKDSSRRKDILSKMDQELISREQLLLSHKRILCELNTVMSHRVKEQKSKENELIEKKYGSDAVVKMGWDATIAPLKTEKQVSSREESYFGSKCSQVDFAIDAMKENLFKYYSSCSKSQPDDKLVQLGTQMLPEMISEENLDVRSEKTSRSADFETVTTSEAVNTRTYIKQGNNLTSEDISDAELDEDYRNEERKILMRSIISKTFGSEISITSQQNANSPQCNLLKLNDVHMCSEETFQDSSSDNDLGTTSSLDENTNL